MAEKSPHILVVDDEPEIFDIIRNIMKEEKYKITFTDNGKDALKAIEKHRFDLVIADVFLPKMSGDEILLNIKKKAPQIPVLMITGLGDNELWIDLINKGALDLIPKPIIKRSFLTKVSAALDDTYPKPHFRA